MNRAVTSNDNIFLPGDTSNSSIFFIHCVLFFTICSVLPTSGLRTMAKYLTVLYVLLPVLDTIDLTGVLSLWIFGNP